MFIQNWGWERRKDFFFNVLLLEFVHQINLWVVFGPDCQAIWMIQSVASIFHITVIYMFRALLLDIYLLVHKMCSVGIFKSTQHWLLSALKGHFHKHMQLNFKTTCGFLLFPVVFNANVKFLITEEISFVKTNYVKKGKNTEVFAAVFCGVLLLLLFCLFVFDFKSMLYYGSKVSTKTQTLITMKNSSYADIYFQLGTSSLFWCNKFPNHMAENTLSKSIYPSPITEQS